MRLWGRDDVKSLLEPKTMRLGLVLDMDGVAEFLRRAREKEFAFDEEWARILSLEVTLRTLEDGGVRLVS